MRAKRTLAEARVPFEVPRTAELAPRLASVLEVIYLVFNEGYAATAGDDWLLAQLAASPVVELNRAVAVAMAFGAAAGLALVDALRGEPSLQSYHLLPTVRGDLLAKLGRTDEACAEFSTPRR